MLWAWLLVVAQAEPPAASGAVELPPAAEDAADGSAVTSEFLDDLQLRLAGDANKDGLRQLEAGDYPAALATFLEAHALAPEDPGIARNLAKTYYQLGNLTKAEQIYRIALDLDPKRLGIMLGLADVLTDAGEPAQLAEASDLLVRARERRGNQPRVILRQARVAARRDRFDEAERYYLEAAKLREFDDEARLEVGDFYRDSGRPEEATRWYQRVTPGGPAAVVASERQAEMEIAAQARRFGWPQRSVEAASRARQLTQRARGFVRRGRTAEAATILREALDIAPQFTEARALLGDVAGLEGDPQAAEVEYLRALAFDQGDVEIHVKLGELYLGLEGRAADAAIILNRAVQLSPERGDLQLTLARAYRLSGDFPKALRAVEAYLAGSPDESGIWRARSMRAALRRLLAQDPKEVAAEEPTGVRADLVRVLNQARALVYSGRTDAAMAVLRSVVASEGGTPLRNMEARILGAAGRTDEAVQAYRASLDMEPDQAEVHTELALLLEEMGQESDAATHLEQAEALGYLEAGYHLARLGVDDVLARGWFSSIAHLGAVLRARDRAAVYVQADPEAVYIADARDLLETLDAGLTAYVAVAILVLFALVVGLLVVRGRFFGGATLRTLLVAFPEAGPEVQRVLSAIRHEVLKHNTMVLTGLVEAISEGGARDDEAARASSSLLDESGNVVVLPRLDEYAADLEKIGRTYGERLNLRRKDPALSALFRGFNLLGRLGPDLSGFRRLKPVRRLRLLRGLRRATRLLNADGYEAVRALLDELRVLCVDEALLRGVFRRTCREPALARLSFEPLALDLQVEMPCAVAIPRAAFEDILGNLLRNAIQSSMRHTEEEIAIGLGVDSDVNPVTGHEWLRFGVRDRSPEELTGETLLGRDIEGGLGIAAELATRFEGALEVENELASWNKAVVLRLPRGELEEEVD